MKMVKLSDFYPYDRNKGGIQELHHKIESKTLQYWGEDSGILIGITPIYKGRGVVGGSRSGKESTP